MSTQQAARWAAAYAIATDVVNHAALLDRIVQSASEPIWSDEDDGTVTVTVDAQLWHAAVVEGKAIHSYADGDR